MHSYLRTIETAKFPVERRLRVSAKYLIRRSGISPPSRLVTRSAPAPRERKEVYHKSPPLWAKRFTAEKCRLQAAPCFYIEACFWEVTGLFIYASKPSCTWNFRVHHFPSVSFVSVSASSFAISGGNSPNASLILQRTLRNCSADILCFAPSYQQTLISR